MPKKASERSAEMNIEKYTQNAQQIVLDCQNIAVAMGNQMVDGEHIHLALLKQQDGLIPKLLQSMGVNIIAVTKDVQAEVDKIAKVSGGADNMYGTRRFNKIFMDAEALADQFKDEYVSVEHIYLALLAERERRAREYSSDMASQRKSSLKLLPK